MKDKTAHRIVVMLFTGLLGCVVLVLLLLYPKLSNAAEGTVFVSKKVPGLYVQVVFHPRAPKSDAAKTKWQELARGLRQEFQPVTHVHRRSAGYAQCNVVLRDWETGDPNFQSTCFSEAMWSGDSPLVFVDLPETVENALTGLHTFALNHQMRLARPGLQKLSRMSST